MQGVAFWSFLGFGILTALVAFAGGLWALSRTGGAGTSAAGFLLLFLGGSLILMLGSLFFIRTKEKRLK